MECSQSNANRIYEDIAKAFLNIAEVVIIGITPKDFLADCLYERITNSDDGYVIRRTLVYSRSAGKVSYWDGLIWVDSSRKARTFTCEEVDEFMRSK
jgi:hypothetical protein